MHWENLINAQTQSRVCNMLGWTLVILTMRWCGQLKQNKKKFTLQATHKQHLINLCVFMRVFQSACHDIPPSIWCNVRGLIFVTMATQLRRAFTVWAASLSMPVTLGGLEMRRHHLTCVATAGTVGSWVNAGNTFFGDSPKTIGWRALFNCCVEYCNYETVSQILRE